MQALSKEQFARINVVGVSGSGKSSLAKRLAEQLGVPHIQLDALYHEPNWKEAEVEVFRERLRQALLACENWVIDGNYHSKVHDLKWQNASMILWLDLPFWQTFWQALKRAFTRAWSQEELWGSGNRESFRRSFFSRDSVLLWTLTSYARVRRRYAKIQTDPQWAHIKIIRLRSHNQAEALLQSIR